MKRKINNKLIREWIKINGKGSLERLAFESGCSASMVQKLSLDTYKCLPKIDKIEGLCRVTGYEINELFPLVEDREKDIA